MKLTPRLEAALRDIHADPRLWSRWGDRTLRALRRRDLLGPFRRGELPFLTDAGRAAIAHPQSREVAWFRRV